MKRPSSRFWSVQLFHMRDVRRNVLPKFIEIIWRRHVGVHPDHRAPAGRPEWYESVNSS